MSATYKQLKLRLHTAYYNNYFLLRTEIVVNGQRTQVDIDDRGWLTLNCRYPKAAVTFDSLIRQVDATLQQHFIHGVSQYWCEEMPLFQLKVTGPDDLKTLFELEEQIQEDIALKFNDSITTRLQSSNPKAPPPELLVLAKMEVFFLIPDNVNKDGQLIRVDKNNLLHCVDLLKESVIFDFGALCRAYRENPNREDKGPDGLRCMMKELEEVVGWYDLGLHFNAPPHVLEMIESDYQKTKDKKRELFKWWLKTNEDEKRSWAVIVLALANSGYRYLAEKIAMNYGVPVPAPQEKVAESEKKTTQPPPNAIVQKIGTEVEASRQDIESKDRELAKQNQTLKIAEKKKKTIAASFSGIKTNIGTSEKKVTQLLSQKENLQEQLKKKEKEMLVFKLSNITEQKELLEEVVAVKNTEISNLEKELEKVNSELEEANAELGEYKVQIRKIQSDLSRKSEEVKSLREANAQKKQELDLKRKEVDQLRMQQTAAEQSNDKYKKKTTILIGSLEKEAQRKSEEMKELEKKLKEKEAEILRLHQKIASQESSLAEKEINLPEKTTILNQLTVLIQQLYEAEDEKEQQSLNLTLCKREADYNQKQAKELKSKISKPANPPPVARKPQSPTSSTSTQLQIKIKTTQGKNAPRGMYRGSAAIDSVKKNIYITPMGTREVYQYNKQQDLDVWQRLQDCPYPNSGLVVMDNLLVSVGGGRYGDYTNKLFRLQRDHWDHFSSMNTARHSPALASHPNYTIVIGGYNQSGGWIASVEVFYKQTWSELTHLPYPIGQPSATLCGEQLYVLSGWGDGDGYCCSIRELSTSSGPPPALTWTPIPQPPVWASTIATLSGQPVVVGGKVRGRYTLSSTVYSLSHGQWVECGHLCEARCHCLVASHSTPHMLVVVGGFASIGWDSATVDVCSVV